MKHNLEFYRTNMSSSMKKLKSYSSSFSNKLVSGYNKVKHTVKEYQAPSTVSTPYKGGEKSTADTAANNDDNISM